MKRVFVVLRNVGAVFCIAVAVIVFATNLVEFFYGTHTSAEATYDVAKMALGVNFLLIPVVFVGNVLLKAEAEKSINFLGFSGVCGALASGAWGVLVMLSGFCAGYCLIPIVLFLLSLYGSMAIYFTAVYFAYRIRDMQEIQENKTLSGCGCYGN